jgi:hypothetical protein
MFSPADKVSWACQIAIQWRPCICLSVSVKVAHFLTRRVQPFSSTSWVGSLKTDPKIMQFRWSQLGHSSKMAAKLDLVSVDYLTNAWVIWSSFFVVYWGSLEKGSWRTPESTGLIFLGVTGGRFRCSFKMAARQPYWFRFCRLSDECLGRLLRFFLWLIGGDWMKVPLDDQHRSSFKMAAILIWFPSILWRTPKSGLTGGRFLSMTSATAHSRWLPYLSKVTLQRAEYWTRPRFTTFLVSY